MTRRGLSAIKQVVRGALGEHTLGALDYYRHPERRAAWGGPFNGQLRRQELFQALIATLAPAAIVETGTYLGTTTEFMAAAGLPVFTIEGDARNYGFARARLRRRRNISLVRGDSPSALAALFDGPLASLGDRVLFFYLDAHWNADLPLADELGIIFDRCPRAVVMVDDFEVPSDAGYTFDDYGPGLALDADYVAPVIARYALSAFYPTAPSELETGMKRGCVVLCKSDVHGGRPLPTGLLRQGVLNDERAIRPNATHSGEVSARP